jgi:prepilin-type N-terminal cleavage/methylation domain-containing protein
MIKKNNNGFSLFEILITVSIIGILTAVAAISYSGASRKARDSRRMSDLEKIRIALELYRQNVGTSYPTNLENSTLKTYLPVQPIDPKLKTNYVFSASGYTYYVCANVEDVGSTTTNVSGCSGLPAGFAGYYKVVNP